MKAHVSYPGKFMTMAAARIWFANFVVSYHGALSHSDLQHIKPLHVIRVEYSAKIRQRNETMKRAFNKNTLRL